MLKPPYQGSNTLMVAKTIVDKMYESIPENLYSEELRRVVVAAL